jgi:hypothetical protein
VLRELWERITQRRRDGAAERAQEWEHMSPEERRYMSEGVEDQAARRESEVYLSGGDPEIGPED